MLVRALKVHTQKMTELFVAADENGNGRLDQASSTMSHGVGHGFEGNIGAKITANIIFGAPCFLKHELLE